MGAANFRPNSINRLQFFVILLGFFLLLIGQVWISLRLHQGGLICLYSAVCLAWFLLIEGIVSLGGKSRRLS